MPIDSYCLGRKKKKRNVGRQVVPTVVGFHALRHPPLPLTPGDYGGGGVGLRFRFLGVYCCVAAVLQMSLLWAGCRRWPLASIDSAPFGFIAILPQAPIKEKRHPPDWRRCPTAFFASRSLTLSSASPEIATMHNRVVKYHHNTTGHFCRPCCLFVYLSARVSYAGCYRALSPARNFMRSRLVAPVANYGCHRAPEPKSASAR
ncbi:hypothetical protein MAPG_06862 [Magnaporthiopsis poae ATCC 64411]|uniref:Uncharacterized protein n=1 Tax=Magnaporthiopsis poae (strain ATCC 64411 / 73-15) TaxID=644358 RepID=A0A0C4E369_MAGP6|nr:hypothetical protein MAPG_06862 [Magnaporthiopsis poae ATCC 64411]